MAKDTPGIFRKNVLKRECSNSWVLNQGSFALRDCVIEGRAEPAPAQNKEGNLGEINIQYSNCFLVYCTRLLQNIKNREKSLKYTVNFIITKKSLTQQPLKSTENISQALLGAGSRLYKANSFLITSS